jgi:Ca2+-dependent lipid-binding protein
MDIGTGKCDGYVVAKYGGNPEIKTEVVKNTYNPTWLEKLLIPVTTPTLTDLVKLTVKDWDAVSKQSLCT